jgi:hypothetical protein
VACEWTVSSEGSIVGTCLQGPREHCKNVPEYECFKDKPAVRTDSEICMCLLVVYIHNYWCISQYTSRETAPLYKYVGTQGNFSNVVCQAESVYQGYSCRLFLRVCVLDSYATAKI